jgi:hypothetical protein
LHRSYFGLLPCDDFFGKLSNERVPAVDQHQASHFDGAGVMRYHHRKKITVRITGLPRRSICSCILSIAADIICPN